MKQLAADEILELWDTTFDQSTVEKSLMLLAKACSTKNIAEIAHLSIGDRDARLLQIREWLFGVTLENKAICPNCLETVEWKSNTGTLHLQAFSDDLFVRNFELKKNGYYINFRLPDSADVMRITASALNETSYKQVIADCILSSKNNEEGCDIHSLPDHIWEDLNDRMSEEDPQADIRLQLTCPNCKHQWEMYFDIASYLWSEINNWAKKILEEVYLLARTFSWSEREILNMSPHRRRLYLEMIQK